MSEEHYDIEELVANRSFREYVLDGLHTAKWQGWTAQEDNKQKAEKAEKLIRELRFTDQVNEVDYLEGRENLRRWIEQHRNITGLYNRDKKDQKDPWNSLKVAAIIIMLLSAGAWFYFTTPSSSNLAQQTGSSSEPISYITKRSPKGHKLTVRMPDGTKVKLNANSELVVPETFSASVREVFLKGEAYFEVAHDLSRPFIIHSGGLTTRVLGTSFNLKAYPTDNTVEIALVEGRVEVSGEGDDSVVMKPDEWLMVNKETNKRLLRGNFDKRQVLGWKEDIISFHKASWEQIQQTLTDWYNVDFELKTSLEGKAFTGDFENQSLDEVLTGIGFSLHFKHKISGRSVVIVPAKK